MIIRPQSLLPWGQWEDKQRGFKVVCNASPYMDADTTGMERRNHVVDVFSSAFPVANPCAPRPVANLDSCLVREQHTLLISGAISLGRVKTLYSSDCRWLVETGVCRRECCILLWLLRPATELHCSFQRVREYAREASACLAAHDRSL